MNGGQCSVITLQAVCVCPKGRIGPRCTIVSRSTEDIRHTGVVVAVCSVGAAVFLVVAALLLYTAYSRHSAATVKSDATMHSDNASDTPFAFSGQAKAYSARSTFTTTIPSHYA